MKHIVFLDDERVITDVNWISYPEYSNVITLRSFKSFKNFVDENQELLKDCLFSFDHDLQDFNEDNTENTGSTCLNYLLNNYKEPRLTALVHSKNPVGSLNMVRTIMNYNSGTWTSHDTYAEIWNV